MSNASQPASGAIMPARAETQPFDPIEMSGKVIALMAALLPAGGFLTRAIAFTITFGPDWAVPLAWSAPLPQLAVTGLYSLLLALPVPVALWLAWRREIARESRDNRLSLPDRLERRIIRHGGLMVAVGVAVVLVDFFLLPGWPIQLFGLAMVVPLILGPRLSWRGKDRRRFRDVWWVVVLVVLIADVIGGLTGLLVGFVEADYEFDPSATSVAVNGSYQQLGEADGFAYLQKCGSSQIYVVNDRAIDSIRQRQLPSGSVGVSLIQVLQGATPEVGAHRC
jgi:hypothetical protein